MGRIRRRRYATRRRPRKRARPLLRGVALALAAILTGTLLCVTPWAFVDPPTTAFMVRSRLETGVWPEQRWVPLRVVADAVVVCALAAEDQKFALHHGFDFESIQKVLSEDGRRRGASTITQQTVKNLYLWPGRSWLRKGLEAYLTVFVELLWPKRRILEVYLNVAQFGPGLFGVGAASQRFFQKPPHALDFNDAALLVAVLPNPEARSPTRPTEALLERAAAIRRAARTLGPAYLSEVLR